VRLLLSPHFDDETLFAGLICIRERPLVLFCFDGAPRHGSFDVRWREAQEATRVLGCDALALREIYETLEERLSVFDPEHVWASLPEEGGNADHNFVGEIAERLWPGRVSFYATYTDEGRSEVGYPVPADPEWVQRKREAMACYESQLAHPYTAPHFSAELAEYEVVPVAVN